MKNLVLLACLLVAIVVAYPSEEEDHKKKMKEHMKELFQVCMDEVGFTEEEKEKAKEHHWREIEETKRGCLKACVLKKEGVMEGSELKLDKIHEHIEEMHKDEPEKKEKLKSITSECHEEVSEISEECKKAGEYWKCVMKHMKHEHGHHKSTEEQT